VLNESSSLLTFIIHHSAFIISSTPSLTVGLPPQTRSLTLAVLNPAPPKSLFTLYRYKTSSRRTSVRRMTPRTGARLSHSPRFSR